LIVLNFYHRVGDVVHVFLRAEIHIGFDPARLESGTVSKGELLARGTCDRVFFFPATSTGKVWFAASRLGGSPTGVTGSGTIATINFKCIANGTISLLSIDSTDLRNANLQTIPVTGTSGASVTAEQGTGTATTLAIVPAWCTVTSGGTVSYTATAKDNEGNIWTVTIDTVFSSDDPKGTFTSNIYTAGKVGTWTIAGIYNGLPGTASVVVTTHGTATVLAIEPSCGTVTSGATVSYTATAKDTVGNTWTVTAAFSSNDTLGTFTGSTYTAGRVGTATITGKYNGLSDTATVVVTTHGTATTLAIEPSWGTVTSGGTISYTATAKDNAGNIWTVTTDTVFSSDDPNGTFTGSMYLSGTVDTWTITGRYNGSDYFATLIVQPELVKNITIEPATISTHMRNKPFSLKITTVDKDGKSIPYSGTFTLSDLTGSITPQVVQIVDGVWTGSISIGKSMFNNRITFGIAGINASSNSFNVLIDDASDERIDDEGVGLEIKSGSVNEDYCLQINHNPTGYEINQANAQSGTASILLDTRCEIKGTTANGELISSFQQPARLSLKYQPESLGNIDAKTLQICRLQGTRWVPVPGDVYLSNNEVTVSINEPGIFILRGVPFGKSPFDVIVYPNPCKGTEIIFRHTDDYIIEIYDLSGDLVKRVHEQGAEYRWDTRDYYGRLLDSGVYFYVIIGKKENNIGKVVIIR
ncbi:MAG: T9SS type A sorting domain-containing protein, partial [Candidatus Desantisbacteria bacterium]